MFFGTVLGHGTIIGDASPIFLRFSSSCLRLCGNRRTNSGKLSGIKSIHFRLEKTVDFKAFENRF